MFELKPSLPPEGNDREFNIRTIKIKERCGNVQIETIPPTWG